MSLFDADPFIESCDGCRRLGPLAQRTHVHDTRQRSGHLPCPVCGEAINACMVMDLGGCYQHTEVERRGAASG